MTLRTIPAAEARAMREAATGGNWIASDDCEPQRICHTQLSAYDRIIAGHDAAGRGHWLSAENARLMAAAPDLTHTVEALEAERDALRKAASSVIEAHDAIDAKLRGKSGGGAPLGARLSKYEAALVALREVVK